MDPRTALWELASTHPALERVVSTFESEFGSDIPTSALGELGVMLVDLINDIEPTAVEQLFEMVELHLACGDEPTETAVATGFLEAVVSRGESSGRGDAMLSHFGPKARQFVSEWNESLGIVSDEN